jgi:hypothetical protein
MTPVVDWRESRQIESPDALACLVTIIVDAVESGYLRQFTPPSAPFASEEDVRAMPPHGPWPDYLELYFEEVRTGMRYRLAVETFHGCGGRWERIT